MKNKRIEKENGQRINKRKEEVEGTEKEGKEESIGRNTIIEVRTCILFSSCIPLISVEGRGSSGCHLVGHARPSQLGTWDIPGTKTAAGGGLGGRLNETKNETTTTLHAARPPGVSFDTFPSSRIR